MHAVACGLVMYLRIVERSLFVESDISSLATRDTKGQNAN